MMVLIHQDPVNGKPLGVWVEDLTNAYSDQLAFRMGQGRLKVARGNDSWDDFLDRQAHASPYVIRWSVGSEPDGSTPGQILARLEREWESVNAG